MKRIVGLSLIWLFAVTLGGCNGHTTVRGGGAVVIHDDHTSVAVVFNDSDRHHIHNYYRERNRYKKEKHYRKDSHRHHLPPGLAKREQLPPGLAKRDHLPPGLHTRRLPYELERNLSRLPEGVIRVRIGTDIVLMDERTRVVLDVIHDIPLD